VKRIREANRALQERAREKAKAQRKRGEHGRAETEDRYNSNDSESRIMKSSGEGSVQQRPHCGRAGVGIDRVRGGEVGGQRRGASGADDGRGGGIVRIAAGGGDRG
jgi:hypothetical protein